MSALTQGSVKGVQVSLLCSEVVSSALTELSCRQTPQSTLYHTSFGGLVKEFAFNRGLEAMWVISEYCLVLYLIMNKPSHI